MFEDFTINDSNCGENIFAHSSPVELGQDRIETPQVRELI